jgi:hypothetical protein
MADEKPGDSIIVMEPLPTDIGGVKDERRLPVQLFNYWNKLRGERAFPSEDAIDSDDISDIWDHCFLIQVNDLKNRKRADFTYLGKKIIEVYHDLLTEEDEMDFISPSTSHLSQNFWQVIETRKPIMQAGQFMTSRRHQIKFRQCLLPIGKDDSEVDAIFGCARLKLYL